MTARRKPVAVVGVVQFVAPSQSFPYYRLTWTEPDGRLTAERVVSRPSVLVAVLVSSVVLPLATRMVVTRPRPAPTASSRVREDLPACH